MKKKWEPKEVRLIPRQVSEDKYDGRIAEVAEILYDLFCQLEKSDKAKPIGAGDSPSDVTLPERRTGTHG